ncbi:glycosyltransferase family 4 protein, partial [Salidesulfovibrio brasiliensis]|uniref:glycosyltransferase family 4 protein n=1 Tax=Salidesulfovibrio brasiliensis TaxID=221711 RepID=UPI0012EE74A8
MVIGCAAMMRPGVKTEGVQWLVRTVAGLRDSGVNAFLAVAGGGDNQEACTEYATEMLGDACVFTGPVERDELPGFYSALDIFAFPGIRESVGMVYLEAQACGVPCVATDDLGAPRVVEHGETGLISPVDEAAFAEAVSRLAGDEG